MQRFALPRITKDKRTVAYFSMEIGLDHRIPTYSGGLGILAGDTIKAFADLNVPVIAVTLLSDKGYFYQKLDDDGNQKELPVKWSKDDFLIDTETIIDLKLKDRTIKVKAWEYNVIGCKKYEVPIYFLDTDLADNSDYDRTLTQHLYGGDAHYRMCQELVLGIGGVLMLERLGYTKIEKYHMNEGHAAFIALQLYNNLKGSVPDNRLLYEIRKHLVFTTHTPVPAGRDNFPIVDVEQMVSLPKEFKQHIIKDDKLSMILLALFFSQYINGVAQKHGQISRDMFPDYPIDSITNGVHSATWTSDHMGKVFDKYIPGWRHDSYSFRYAISIPKDEIIAAHDRAKADLIDHINARHNVGFDRDIFTIGYARRATAYKRPMLFFEDVDKLLEINDTIGQLQIIFAGKAHPKDTEGKEYIKKIFEIKNKLKDRLKIVYLENYNMESAKLLCSGVDLWLNTPLPPMEASGTSGMKAAHNGIPQLSTLDGWWLEGYIEHETGWSIGSCTEEKRDDKKHAEELYNKLKEQILPCYYANKDKWANIMLHCIALNASFFNTHRMVEQYVVNAYFR